MKAYGPGESIKTIEAFDLALEEGALLYVKNWNKTAMPIIIANMQYRVVKQFIKAGQICFAEKINFQKEKQGIIDAINSILHLKKEEVRKEYRVPLSDSDRVEIAKEICKELDAGGIIGEEE